MLPLLKKLTPPFLQAAYHKSWAILAKALFGNPSEKMIVIGVTGTNGKSTTAILIVKILEAAGHKVGLTSTALFKIGEKEWLNDKKMTMLGRLALQKMLSAMVKAGCRYAVVETSSEGIKQFRHLGIHYDIGVFTNLTPEHLEAHGGFANYKKAKLELFAKLEKDKKKIIDNQEINKVIAANIDDEHGQDFVKYKVDKIYTFGLGRKDHSLSVQAEDLSFNPTGVSFKIKGVKFNLKLFGKFNVYNCLAAIAVAESQGIDQQTCQEALENVSGVPGRMEFITEGQKFKVLVDYAPEVASLNQLYQTIADHQIAGSGKIIHVLGSCGGGRDQSRRPILGQIAGEQANYVIITNEDPYDDDPDEIINQVAQGAIAAGKILNQDLFKVLDREKAIEKAICLAKTNDLVLLTGKGCEQAICLAGGKKLPWDEREVVRKLLKEIV